MVTFLEGIDGRTRNVEISIHVITNDTMVKDECPFVGTHLKVVSDRWREAQYVSFTC